MYKDGIAWIAKSGQLRFGLNKEQVEDIWKRQGRGCAICGATGKLVVDHCHTTEYLRGFLCHSCNLLLGLAKDDLDRLSKAIEYIKQFRGTIEEPIGNNRAKQCQEAVYELQLIRSKINDLKTKGLSSMAG